MKESKTLWGRGPSLPPAKKVFDKPPAKKPGACWQCGERKPHTDAGSWCDRCLLILLEAA